MIQITEKHRKLEIMVGSWEGEEIIHPSPFSPEGGKAYGRSTNRLALDGLAVIHDYQQ